MQQEARERGRANQGEARKIPEIPQSSAGKRTNLSSILGSASVAARLLGFSRLTRHWRAAEMRELGRTLAVRVGGRKLEGSTLSPRLNGQ